MTCRYSSPPVEGAQFPSGWSIFDDVSHIVSVPSVEPLPPPRGPQRPSLGRRSTSRKLHLAKQAMASTPTRLDKPLGRKLRATGRVVGTAVQSMAHMAARRVREAVEHGGCTAMRNVVDSCMLKLGVGSWDEFGAESIRAVAIALLGSPALTRKQPARSAQESSILVAPCHTNLRPADLLVDLSGRVWSTVLEGVATRNCSFSPTQHELHVTYGSLPLSSYLDLVEAFDLALGLSSLDFGRADPADAMEMVEPPEDLPLIHHWSRQAYVTAALLRQYAWMYAGQEACVSGAIFDLINLEQAGLLASKYILNDGFLLASATSTAWAFTGLCLFFELATGSSSAVHPGTKQLRGRALRQLNFLEENALARTAIRMANRTEVDDTDAHDMEHASTASDGASVDDGESAGDAASGDESTGNTVENQMSNVRRQSIIYCPAVAEQRKKDPRAIRSLPRQAELHAEVAAISSGQSEPTGAAASNDAMYDRALNSQVERFRSDALVRMEVFNEDSELGCGEMPVSLDPLDMYIVVREDGKDGKEGRPVVRSLELAELMEGEMTRILKASELDYSEAAEEKPVAKEPRRGEAPPRVLSFCGTASAEASGHVYTLQEQDRLNKYLLAKAAILISRYVPVDTKPLVVVQHVNAAQLETLSIASDRSDEDLLRALWATQFSKVDKRLTFLMEAQVRCTRRVGACAPAVL